MNQSLGLGATLFATVQRGQEVDKSVMNAASFLYVCQHNTDDDAKYMAKKLGVTVPAIPRVPLQFLVWTPSRGHVLEGNVTFTDNRPVFNQTKPRKKSLKARVKTGLFAGVINR